MIFLYRLSGLSPFAGEDDLETLANVQRCDWEFAEDAFTHISPEAKDFIRQLLIRQPQYVNYVNYSQLYTKANHFQGGFFMYMGYFNNNE